MVLNPNRIGLQCSNELIGLGPEILSPIKKQIVDLCDRLGDPIVSHALKHDRGKPLLEVCNLLYLPRANRRRDRVWADNENDCICFPDKAQQLASPVLKFWKITSVNTSPSRVLAAHRFHR
jgi:hypothetical protein